MAVTEVVLLLCDRVKREAGTNKAIIDGVFDQVAAVLPGMLDATLYLRCLGVGAGPAAVVVALHRPDGSVDRLPPFSFPPSDGKLEGEINLAALPLVEAGRHHFVVTLDGAALASVSFVVIARAAAAPAPPPADAAN